MKTLKDLKDRAESLQGDIRAQGENIATAVDVNTTVMFLVGTVAVVALIVAIRAISAVNR